MDIYVGNLAYSTADDDLKTLFSQHGTVASARVVMDRETGRSRGFGFVVMSEPSEAQAAINAVNGMDFQGRPLRVNESQPRAPGGGGGGGGGGGRGGERGGDRRGGGGGERSW
jgi:RNA recognition motif-containing protein